MNTSEGEQQSCVHNKLEACRKEMDHNYAAGAAIAECVDQSVISQWLVELACLPNTDEETSSCSNTTDTFTQPLPQTPNKQTSVFCKMQYLHMNLTRFMLPFAFNWHLIVWRISPAQIDGHSVNTSCFWLCFDNRNILRKTCLIVKHFQICSTKVGQRWCRWVEGCRVTKPLQPARVGSFQNKRPKHISIRWSEMQNWYFPIFHNVWRFWAFVWCWREIQYFGFHLLQKTAHSGDWCRHQVWVSQVSEWRGMGGYWVVGI